MLETDEKTLTVTGEKVKTKAGPDGGCGIPHRLPFFYYFLNLQIFNNKVMTFKISDILKHFFGVK